MYSWFYRTKKWDYPMWSNPICDITTTRAQSPFVVAIIISA